MYYFLFFKINHKKINVFEQLDDESWALKVNIGLIEESDQLDTGD